MILGIAIAKMIDNTTITTNNSTNVNPGWHLFFFLILPPAK